MRDNVLPWALLVMTVIVTLASIASFANSSLQIAINYGYQP